MLDPTGTSAKKYNPYLFLLPLISLFTLFVGCSGEDVQRKNSPPITNIAIVEPAQDTTDYIYPDANYNNCVAANDNFL